MPTTALLQSSVILLMIAQFVGRWTFFLGPGGGTKEINCSAPFPVVKALQVDVMKKQLLHELFASAVAN